MCSVCIHACTFYLKSSQNFNVQWTIHCLIAYTNFCGFSCRNAGPNMDFEHVLGLWFQLPFFPNLHTHWPSPLNSRKDSTVQIMSWKLSFVSIHIFILRGFQVLIRNQWPKSRSYSCLSIARMCEDTFKWLKDWFVPPSFAVCLKVHHLPEAAGP